MKAFFAVLLAVFSGIYNFFATDGAFTQLKEKGDITGYSENVQAYKELPVLYTDTDGKFTVLQFSDTHFTTGLSWNDVSVLGKMEELTLKYSPDLVVVSGDMLDDGESGAYNKKFSLDKVIELFESLEQYWAYIPGNNDGIKYGTSADVVAYLSESEYCLCADEKDISGGAQYTIDISDGEKVVHSFVFLDTMDYDDEDEEHIYGYVHADQVEWCRTAVNEKINLNKDIMLSVFIHENTPNFAKAAIDGEAYKDGYSTLDEVKEEYNIPKNAPLDDVFADSGRVGLVSMGHVHPNEGKCSFYDGIYYHITPQTKVSSTLITIDTKADNVKDMYNFEQVN